MSRTPGVIDAAQAYTIAEFRRRMGIGDFAMRQLRRDGLRVVEIGRKRFILGRSWLKFLEEQSNGKS